MIEQFETPPDSCRPIQAIAPFEIWSGTSDDAMRAFMMRVSKAGVGGLMVNVSLENYLSDETAWQVLRRGVLLAHEMGLRVWIYDEKGYPSGAAGGLVLAQYPEGEARGLIRVVGTDGQPRYEDIRLYEATHATENFYEKRACINILDRKAVATFIETTHDRYARVLEPIGKYVEAFFTDEPSLISAYIPQGKVYPKTLPWHSRLPEQFRSRKGYDLMPHMESLFIDTGEIDRKIRCDFYDVIADICAETYFGQIQEWCNKHSVSSSGHLLGEETMVWQTEFDGDPYRCYRRFDIPGIDMILSDPETIMVQLFVIVAKIAGSATRLQGKRRVMCEISDFFGSMAGHPATMDQMRATAGILYSLGVTDLVCMYPASYGPEENVKPTEFPVSEFRKYTDFVSRLKYIFMEGKSANRVALLYPIRSLWAHFTPSDRSMYEQHPNPQVRFLDGAFTNLCRDLLQQQVNFDIVDELTLSNSRVEDRRLVHGEQRYDVLILPPMDTIGVKTMDTIARFVEAGGSVFAHPLMPKYAADGPQDDDHIRSITEKMIAAGSLGGSNPGAPPMAYLVNSRVPPDCVLSPSSPHVLCTTISRDDGPAYFLVNTSSKEYTGDCTFLSAGDPVVLDPVTGKDRALACERVGNSSMKSRVTLRPFESLFVIFRRQP